VNAAPSYRWADEDNPVRSRMIFVSATACNRAPSSLVRAWDLYQGGCLPQLRERMAAHPRRRGRVRMISAEYGVLHPDTLVLPSARLMTKERAAQLRPTARRRLMAEFATDGVPRETMLLAEYPYGTVVTDIFHIPGLRPYTSLCTDRPGEQWSLISDALDTWGWP
jgi:hypothetical protein